MIRRIDRTKDENHVIIPVDAEKALTEHSILNTQQIGWGRNAPQPELKAIEDKPVATIVLNSVRMESFPLRLGMALEVVARAVRQEKERKSI